MSSTSWSMKWTGRATDFVPDLLVVTGKPGRVAALAKDLLYEAAQAMGDKDPQAFVSLGCSGWDEREDVGHGHFTMVVEIDGPPSEIQQSLTDQQPVNLLGLTSSPEAVGSVGHDGGGTVS